MFRIAAVATLALALTVSTSAWTQQQFQTEQQAQAHCPKDVVVWLNLPTGVYHLKGARWYGATKSGAYVCKAEADKAGDRQSLRG